MDRVRAGEGSVVSGGVVQGGVELGRKRLVRYWIGRRQEGGTQQAEGGGEEE